MIGLILEEYETFQREFTKLRTFYFISAEKKTQFFIHDISLHASKLVLKRNIQTHRQEEN